MLKEKFGEDFTGQGVVLFNDKPDETLELLRMFPALEVCIHNEHVDKKYKPEMYQSLQNDFAGRVLYSQSFHELSQKFTHRFLKEVFWQTNWISGHQNRLFA